MCIYPRQNCYKEFQCIFKAIYVHKYSGIKVYFSLHKMISKKLVLCW